MSWLDSKQMDGQVPPKVQVLLLGDNECGKTTFLTRICRGNSAYGQSVQNGEQSPTVYNVRLYNRTYTFEFYEGFTEECNVNVAPKLIVLTFDIGLRITLLNAQKVWYRAAARRYHGQIPLMLLGLKRDLRSENPVTIAPDEAVCAAQEMRCDRYAECSSLTGELFSEALEDLAVMGARTTTEAGALNEPHCCIL